MREEVTKERQATRQEKETVSITCNRCGKKFSKSEEDEYFWDSEVHGFHVGFGYGSSHDTESWSFDLCDGCLVEIVKTFQIVPKGFYQDSCYYVAGEHHQMVFDNWKETGEWEILLGLTYEEVCELDGHFNTSYLNSFIEKHFPDSPLL